MVQKKFILLKKIKRVKEKNYKNQLRLRIVILLGVMLSLTIAGLIFYQATDYVDVSSDLPAIEGISLLLDIEDGIVMSKI